MAMMQSSNCYAHKERQDRMNQVHYMATTCPNALRLFRPLLAVSGINLAKRSQETPDENLRVLIKKGPVSVLTSLKELEDNYERKPEWKVIEEGGVLSIPVEELRMQNLLSMSKLLR